MPNPQFWIADLLYRFALSFFIKLIRWRTLNPNSKIQNLKFPQQADLAK
jgi:hypothetical protein